MPGSLFCGATSSTFCRRTGVCSFEQEVYSKLALRRELEAEIVNHDFFDIGTPEELAKTRADLEAR